MRAMDGWSPATTGRLGPGQQKKSNPSFWRRRSSSFPPWASRGLIWAPCDVCCTNSELQTQRYSACKSSQLFALIVILTQKAANLAGTYYDLDVLIPAVDVQVFNLSFQVVVSVTCMETSSQALRKGWCCSPFTGIANSDYFLLQLAQDVMIVLD